MDDNNIQRSFDLLIAKMGEICSSGVNVPHYKEDCYWYGEWQDMNARIPYCKCKKYPADTIGPNDCESCKQYHSKYKPSKADRIRAMSDEELAYFMANIEPCRESAWLDWLKQEATDG
jgi:hypothetical protein